MNRVFRQGPPEPIAVESSPPVCATCGTPLQRDVRDVGGERLTCPRGCKRVERHG